MDFFVGVRGSVQLRFLGVIMIVVVGSTQLRVTQGTHGVVHVVFGSESIAIHGSWVVVLLLHYSGPGDKEKDQSYCDSFEREQQYDLRHSCGDSEDVHDGEHGLDMTVL